MTTTNKSKMELIVATKKGRVLKINPDNIKCSKRGGLGVRLMKLKPGDEVVSVALKKEESILSDY